MSVGRFGPPDGQDAARGWGSTDRALLSKMFGRRSGGVRDRSHPEARVEALEPEERVEAKEQPALDWQGFAERFRIIEENVEKVVQGKQPEIRLALAGLVA